MTEFMVGDERSFLDRGRKRMFSFLSSHNAAVRSVAKRETPASPLAPVRRSLDRDACRERCRDETRGR